jgi:8-oxo-dGTP pyrophosphatase MutT (NUDIX family)
MSTGPRAEEVEGAIRAILGEVGEYRRPAARALLVSPSGQLMRGTPHQTRWEYPGGGMDEGERTLEAAVRETREEACCLGGEVPDLSPLGTRRGRAYREPLGFGSPRRDGHGTAISQAAA